MMPGMKGLAAGERLGPYEILAPIGAGGMGEVYRARDTKLKRDVALSDKGIHLLDEGEEDLRTLRRTPVRVGSHDAETSAL
jgi:hypothetical protein